VVRRICLERGADCLHTVQLMALHPQTPSSLISFKSRLVLLFLYLFTHVVLEKRPLNGCIAVVVVVVVVVGLIQGGPKTTFEKPCNKLLYNENLYIG